MIEPCRARFQSKALFLSLTAQEVHRRFRIPSILDLRRSIRPPHSAVIFSDRNVSISSHPIRYDRKSMESGSSIQWSAYPALMVAAAFSVGVYVASTVRPASIAIWAAGALASLLFFTGVELWNRRRMVTLAPLARMAGVLLIAVCGGGARQVVYDTPSPRSLGSVVEALPDDVTVRGQIADAPERSASDVQFTLSGLHISGRSSVSIDGNVRVTLRPSPWESSSAPFPALYQGDEVQLTGTVRRAPGPRNPAGFDYAAYLSRRGICCTMYVDSPDQVVRLTSAEGPLTVIAVQVRQYIRGKIHRYVPSSDGRAVLNALLLGDRSRIQADQRERFARTGLMHLLAVSGLHVFLVGMVLYMLLRPILMRFRLQWHTVEIGRSLLTVGVLGLYMLLTGSRPSVVRAVIMSALFIGGIALQRSAHPLNTLGVAALILLILRPTALFDVGFQLSMAAVAAIVTVHPRLLEFIPEHWTASSARDWLVSVVSVSAAATVGTAPILLYHFGWVSVAGLLLNVVGIPCTGLALSAAISMVVTGGLSSVAGAAFGRTADLFVHGLLLTSQHGAQWFSWAGFRMPAPNVWVLGALGAATVALAQWPRPRYRWRTIICALFLVVGGLWSGILRGRGTPTLELVFFDVGQGDAILVTTPANRRMLVDTGSRSPSGARIRDSVVPFFERRGIDNLDTVVITHPDGDHLGGLPALMNEVSIGRVVHSGQQVDTDLFRETRQLLRQEDISTESVQRGDALKLGSSTRIEVLSPPVQPVRHGIESENGRSVVLRIVYGTTDILLTGDIEGDAEEELVRAYGDQLESRVVKIPHHGSETSSTRSFVEAVVSESGNTRAVVSVGRSNRFGLPDPNVMSRWEATGARVYRTSTVGAVWLRTDGTEVQRVRWKD